MLHALIFQAFSGGGLKIFYVVELKKILFTVLAALLFALIAVIILSGKNKVDYAETIASTDEKTVLIIDAGHGGADGGAVAAGEIAESGINLAIALKLEAAARIFGVEVVMTRTSEDLPYPDDADSIRSKKVWDQNSRVELINSYPDGVLISIHQNTYPDPRPSGPQVLYGRIEGSELLGELAQTALNEALAPESRRLASPVSDSIYLMKSSKNPAILVECGFISNENELKLLLDESYQRRIAAVLLASYLQYIGSAYGG